MLDPVPTRLPDPCTKYHRNHPEHDPDALRRFVFKWKAADYTDLSSVWRDPGGGWIRWWWFRDEEGMAHALWMPSLANPKPPLTEDEEKFLKFLNQVFMHKRNFPKWPVTEAVL